MRIGFIGTGIMGRPMALNLLRAGHELQVYARRPEALEPLTGAGARPCASPRESAREAQVVFTVVGDTADVEQVLLGAQGVVEGAPAGSVVVDMSTISPGATRTFAARLAERGIDMADAPVSGGEQGAIAATLSIMVGARPEVFARILPLLQQLGSSIVHVGGNGAGQVTKLCNQVVIGQTLVGIAEAFALTRAAGVDPGRVRAALLGGFAQSRALEVHGQRILDRNFAPGFKTRLHHKDMRLVLETAHDLGVALPGSAQVAQYLNALMGAGRGELDSSALATVIEDLGRARS
jgi:2-hydroxy-3-oxopropionate reductase